MPKARKSENKGLPSRWRFTRNAYYYQVPPGQEHQWGGKQTYKLGNSLHEAYMRWADFMPKPGKVNSIGELLERYAVDVIPTKAAATQTNDRNYLKRLNLVFGVIPLTQVEPKDIYAYVDGRQSKSLGRKEIKLLSHAYTKAVEWGYISRHPFKKEVRFKAAKPRSRYITDEEMLACLKILPKRKKDSIKPIQAYIKLKFLTGMDRNDLLRLQISDLKEDGIHNQRHKTINSTGKRTIYEWTDELRKVVDEAKAVRPVLSNFLFCKRNGEGYFNEVTGKPEGWKSMWQRFMARVMVETIVKERFTEHDLRAKCASDASSLEHARALLSHADSRITDRVYRRKPERVKPSK